MSNHKKTIIVMLVAVASISEAAIASDVFSIKGNSLGMSRATITGNNPQLRCIEVTCFASGATLGELATIATAPVKQYSVRFDDAGDAVRISLVIDMRGAFAVASALKEKYGPPTTESSPYATRGGLKTTRTTHTWAKGGQTMRFTAPGSKIDEANLVLTDDAYMLEAAKKLQKEAAKDL
jgi:hypothetical protein